MENIVKPMDDFRHRRKNVVFWSVTGEVLGSNKYSETRISSSGGGGYVSGSGDHVSGYISAPTIHSRSITNHEFWIRTEDGFEEGIKFRNTDIPLRPGQKITLISAGRDKSWGWYTILVNHSANRHYFMANAERLNQLLKLDLMSGKSLLIAGAMAGGITLGIEYLRAAGTYPDSIERLKHIADYTDSGHIDSLYTYFLHADSWALGLWAAGIFIVCRLVVKGNRILNLIKKLGQHLENLIQFAYRNY